MPMFNFGGQAQVPQQAEPQGGFLRQFLAPETAMPIAAALMGNQGNSQNFANAFGAYGQTAAQTAKRNKTLDFLRREAPELASAVDSGMEPADAYKVFLQQRYAQQADPYKVVGGQIFDTRDKSFMAPPAGSGPPETGLQPQMMRGPNGETIYVQATKDGRLIRSQVPEGFEPYDPYSKAFETGRGTNEGKGIADRNLGQPQAEMALGTAVSSLDRLGSTAAEIMSDPALGRITGVMGMIPNYPGGEAAGVQAKLETLKSQVSFSVLQAMRDASKTGGALGQVSDKENELLQNNLAALNQAQSVEDFQRELKKIVEFTNGAKQRLQNAYMQTYGGGQSGGMPQQGAPQGGNRTQSGVSWSVEP